ncbi:hypothetical protein ACIBL5_26045 [Streptomyces sp. NPDC050516]|uniref:hypothetical protein n=1 Tax=Streptomyces sp. NPDC050516 TaxID=3365621 RepID=UPI00379BCE9F
MTDKKPQPSPPPAPLTDTQRVGQQVGFTDMTTTAGEVLSGMFPFGGPVRLFGKTDFEGHQLNDMIDLVENANPEHLTTAGHALFNARDAIRDAAKELKANIHVVHWEGESGDAFRTWGDKLVGNTHKLADFADVAAVQISAAGSGLASVSKAMPKRDHRAEPVKVADIPPTKRIAGNAEYEAAVAVEKDRQEAINQMNRLSSFYSVSEQTLAAQQPPVFEAMPKVGVPQPLPGTGDPIIPVRAGEPGASTRFHSTDGGSTSHRAVAESVPTPGHLDANVNPHEHPVVGSLPSPVPTLDRDAGTELNSVTPLPAPTVGQVATIPPPSNTTSPGIGPVPPITGGSWSPTADGVTRAVRAVGGISEPAQFRAGVRQGVPGASSAGQSTSNPVGRPADTAQGVGRGSASPTGQSPMGRGVSGGTPRVAGEGSSRSGSAGTAGRSNGIVGGRPNAAAPNSPGSRTRRGTVVGGEGMRGNSKPNIGPGQRGVVGASGPTTSGAAQKSRRLMGNPDGVVGSPKERSAGARSGRNAFTKGGEGLVRERPSDSEDEELSEFED